MYDFELHEQVITMKDRGNMSRRNISSADEVEVRKCVLSSNVTFQDVLLMRISIRKEQDKGRL